MLGRHKAANLRQDHNQCGLFDVHSLLRSERNILETKYESVQNVSYFACTVGSCDDVHVLQRAKEQVVGHEAAAQLLQRQSAHDRVAA